MITDKVTNTLVKAGLSSSQAKIYVTILTLRDAPVKTISKAAEMDRGETYRVVAKLFELGLIEKIIDSPIRFKPIPISEGFSILLERKKRETLEIQKQAQRIINDCNIIARKKSFEEDCSKTFLIPSGGHLNNLQAKIFFNVKKSFDVITCLGEFVRYIESYYEDCKHLLARGVKVRFLVENLEDKELSLEPLDELQYDSNFKMKFVYSQIPTYMCIYDNTGVLISSDKETWTCDVPAYWSKDPIFVAIARNIFDKNWNTRL